MHEEGKYISLDESGAHVIAPSIQEKLAKKSISPSLVTGLEGCGARWLADQFIMRDLFPPPPDNAAVRGSTFHKVMEVFFAHPPADRTKERMKASVSEVLNTEEFADVRGSKDAVMWLRNAVNGYYNMGGKPEAVTIATVGPKNKSGIEYFVKGSLGDASRQTLGFIDQIIEDPTKPGHVIIHDWKSGAKAKQYKAKTGDGLPEQRQQIIYSELLRQDGVKVSGARLIFPVAREVINVHLGDAELRDKCLRDVEETDKKLDYYLQENTFEIEPSFLCAWCPLAKICPKADVKPYAKMQEAFAKQPEIEELVQAVELG